MGRTSLAVLCSRHLGMSRRRFPGVGTPLAGVPQLPSKVPPRVVITCAYLSWFVSIARLNRLPERPEGEPCMHNTV
jgi:hypothetical protein